MKEKMGKKYVEEFRKILKRMTADSNSERYHDICICCHNEDEERIWELCEKFWPNEYAKRNVSIDKYTANEDLDPNLAQKHIDELTNLLDKLGWAKE